MYKTHLTMQIYLRLNKKINMPLNIDNYAPCNDLIFNILFDK